MTLDSLEGIPIRLCPELPKTIKDKDGKDLPLLGVMVGAWPLEMQLERKLPPMAFLVAEHGDG